MRRGAGCESLSGGGGAGKTPRHPFSTEADEVARIYQLARGMPDLALRGAACREVLTQDKQRAIGADRKLKR